MDLFERLKPPSSTDGGASRRVEYVRNFRVLAAEANGIYRVYVVRRDDAEFALGLDPLCLELNEATERALQRVAGMLCLACGHKFMPGAPPPGAFVVVCPGGPAEKRSRSVMTSAVCAPCARRPDRDLWPGWPSLPLTFAEIERMERGESNRVKLVGHYASSLMMLKWDYQTHPVFHDYVCGLLAYPHTPAELREDLALLQEFPPRLLEGFDRALGWRTLEDITQQRQSVLQMLEQNRELADANWLQGATSELAELSQVYPSKFAPQPNMC